MSEMDFYSLPTGKLYKKTKKSRLKNFPAGYVGSFYRNLAENVDNFLGSDFFGKIASDANIPPEDVQKYILATSDFAKGMQTDINHFVTRDRINNASFRQKLDLISKNTLRQQNLLELVFEDISTFDAENPIVSSLLRELDVAKKVVASNLVKNAPGPTGQDFAIQNRLDRLRDVETEPKKEGTITTIIFILYYHHRQFPLVLVRSYHHLHHHLFNPHHQFLIHFNHHHKDLIILLEIFMF